MYYNMTLEFSNNSRLPESKLNTERLEHEDSQERQEELVVATIELFRTHAVKKVNEGNNGVIGLVDQEMLRAFGNLFDDAERGVALKFLKSLKLLKIGSREAIQKEFEAQKLVYDILKYHADLGTCPKPYAHCSFDITDELQEEFEVLGFSGQEADVMFMDFVPGKDLAHIQYEELIRRSIREYKEKSGMVVYSRIGAFADMTAEDIETLSFGEAHRIVSEVFFEPTPATEEGTRAGIRNANVILQELGRLGFEVSPDIILKINKTISLLEEKGVFLIDCHDRNIMIEGDITSADAKVVFVDFGSVQIQALPAGSFDYESADGSIRFVNPRNITARLSRVNMLAKEVKAKKESQPTLHQRIQAKLQGVQNLFASKKEKSLGLPEARNREDNKVLFYQKSLRNALLRARTEIAPLTRQGLLKDYRDASGKKLSIQSDIYAKRHLLEAVMSIIFSLRFEQKISQDEVGILVDKMYTSDDFEDILIQGKLYSDFQKVTADEVKNIIEEASKQ